MYLLKECLAIADRLGCILAIRMVLVDRFNHDRIAGASKGKRGAEGAWVVLDCYIVRDSCEMIGKARSEVS